MLCFRIPQRQIDPGLQAVHLSLHIAHHRSTDDVSITAHHVSGGVARNFGNKILIEGLFRIGRNILVGYALFLQNAAGKRQLLLVFTGIGPYADQIDILLLELLVQLLQLRHFRDAGSASVVPEVDDGRRRY